VRDRRLGRAPRRPTTAISAAAAALVAAVVVNQLLASRSERRHPPRGQVIEVDGVRVRHFEAARGRPVVLIHGGVRLKHIRPLSAATTFAWPSTLMPWSRMAGPST
jgi:hypothetical protein